VSNEKKKIEFIFRFRKTGLGIQQMTYSLKKVNVYLFDPNNQCDKSDFPIPRHSLIFILNKYLGRV